MALSKSPNRTCMHSSPALRGYIISSQICHNVLHLLSTTLGCVPLTSWLPGVLLQWILILFSSFATLAIFMVMHKKLPYCYFNKITVFAGNLWFFTHPLESHNSANITLSQFSYFLHKVISQISYLPTHITPTYLHTHTHHIKILHLQQLLFSL